MINTDEIYKPRLFQNDEDSSAAPFIIEPEIDQCIGNLFGVKKEYLNEDKNIYLAKTNNSETNFGVNIKKLNSQFNKIKYNIQKNFEIPKFITYSDNIDNSTNILITDDINESKYNTINNIINDENNNNNLEYENNNTINNISPAYEIYDLFSNDKNCINQIIEENNEIYTFGNNDKNSSPTIPLFSINCLEYSNKNSNIPLNEFEIINNSFYKDIKNNFPLNKSGTTKRIKYKTNKNEINNTKYKNKKLNEKKFYFQILNVKFKKSGKNCINNSERPQNIRNRIIRNLIQDILPDWINNGNKKEILVKLSKKNLNYNCKGKKLFEIYKLSEEDILNIINDKKNQDFFIDNKSKENFIIKLNLYFEEAFEMFCFKKSREEIYKKVRKKRKLIYCEEENEQFNYNEFFKKFKSKEEYLKEKEKCIKEGLLFKKSFQELLSQYGIKDI